MTILIQIREECTCDNGQGYREQAIMKDCILCNGKGYIDTYVTLSVLKDLLEEIKKP